MSRGRSRHLTAAPRAWAAAGRAHDWRLGGFEPLRSAQSSLHGTRRCQRRDSDHRQARGARMKIVVIGGTGRIGSKLVENLRNDRHEAIPASPDTGVDTITGKGLAEVVEGAQVVVDVANAPD